MQLSVIIVNYNVRHFLEQCLRSVQRAAAHIETEIIVVDNNSVDGSVQMLKENFGDSIILIENKENTGFSKANNQGIRIARGRHVLLLNPDTVVEESAFEKCFAFMEAHPEAGALGVRMINGEGVFLPESKRGLPTPAVSFYKIFGLSRLFPRSKTFGQYHLSYLDPQQNHPVDILSGAFMWIRKAVLDKTGGFDEAFFMYGEDVDLSWRIRQAGYQNYYFADAQIIHYKGESTKKGSLNYVRVFYQAMIIFAQKHFGGPQQELFIAVIRMAVWFRAGLAVLSRLARRIGFPLLESAVIYGLIYGIKSYWEHYVKYIEGGQYPPSFDRIAAPIYTAVFVGLMALMGAYRRPYRIQPVVYASFLGFVAIATVSYLWPQINFSRAIVGLSSVFTMIAALGIRGVLNLRAVGKFFYTEAPRPRVLLAGDAAGIRRLAGMMRQDLDFPAEILGGVSDAEGAAGDELQILGRLDQLGEIIRFYHAGEVIFDNRSIPTERIIAMMHAVQPEGATYKILPPGADYLVGPQAIYSSRHSRQAVYALQRRSARRQKAVFELAAAAALLLSFPLLFWRYQHPGPALAGLLRVLGRRAQLVAYIHPGDPLLPPLKAGLLTPLSPFGPESSPGLNTREMDRHYARSWTWESDLLVLLKGWRYIGTAAS